LLASLNAARGERNFRSRRSSISRIDMPFGGHAALSVSSCEEDIYSQLIRKNPPD